MSKDIRSYLKVFSKPEESTKRPKINNRPILSSSSDEEESNNLKSKVNKKAVKSPKKPRKKVSAHVLSDSEDDTNHKTSKNKFNDSKKETENQLKPISIQSVFGKKPISRINSIPVPKKLQEEESSIHDDDDFEATLNQSNINEIDLMYSAEIEKAQVNGKRKNSRNDDETSSKKFKLNSNADKIENKHKKYDDEAEKSKVNSSSKPNVTNKTATTTKTSNKKLKLDIVIDKKLQGKTKTCDTNEDVDQFEEHIAKKKQQLKTYQEYLHRGGARNPGSKTIPEGADNCLAGLSFVVTGVLDSLERDETDQLIEKYGGRILTAVSKKTDYLVVGDTPGESKLSKAQHYNIKQISEDDLLDLIRSRPAGKASQILQSRKKKELTPRKPVTKSLSKIDSSKEKSLDHIQINSTQSINSCENHTQQKSDEESKSTTQCTINNVPKNENTRVAYIGEAQALVEKYRPKSMKQIIGQHGDKSTAKKFFTWLQNWHKNRNAKTKLTKPSPWAKNDDGAFFKACLLSGPPGVGKTTTAQVVCNELGFDLLEFNASDTRSKRLLKDEISGLLSNTTVKGYFFNNSEAKLSAKHVLLMDEVDGMAGNEDRGGLQELISLIKSTEIPIVCICNDRNNPKMRTLGNYIFDLRFQKPRVEQIKGAMKSLCCKENIKITNEDLDRLIQSTNQDIRQVINHLAMLVSTENNTDNKDTNGHINKDLKLGPWDVVRKVFSSEEHKTMSIHDKSDLFFHDYNIAGLFVQENYLSVVPQCPKNEILERVAASADSLAMGDLVEHSIRGNSSWSMLPVQACYSSVIPGTLMSGRIGAQITFPAWLGRNSKQGKFDRLLQEITVHTRLVTGASKEAINIDYLKSLRDAIVRPLVIEGSGGVEAAINTMNHYHLLRDDLDALVEVSLWPGQRDPMQSIESKTKAAFTRAYNKSASSTPFYVSAATKKKSSLETQDSGFDDPTVYDDEESNDDDDNLDRDRMVMAKKPSVKKVTASSKANVSTSRSDIDKPASKRGRGRGRGK